MLAGASEVELKWSRLPSGQVAEGHLFARGYRYWTGRYNEHELNAKKKEKLR